jgi:hypothetical protein
LPSMATVQSQSIQLQVELQDSRISSPHFVTWPPCRVVDPKFFFFGSGSYFGLNNFESGSGLFMKNTLEMQII